MTDFDKIAVEDFHPRFLARSTMLKKATDAAIGATKADLLHMANKHGRDLRLVHAAHTTMDCSKCGARGKHRLDPSERTYACDDHVVVHVLGDLRENVACHVHLMRTSS